MRRALVLVLLLVVTVQPAVGAPPHVDRVPPVCAASGEPRAVVVYAYAADRTSRHAPIAPLIVDLVAQVNGALDLEAGPFPISYRVECGGDGVVLVHEVRLTTKRANATFDTIKRDLASSGHADARAKYWVWYDGPSPFLGELGTADILQDPRDRPENLANGGPHYAVVWGATAYSLDWRVLMHESAHLMGAVAVDAHDATGDGHTDAPMDVMIPRLTDPPIAPLECNGPWKCRPRPECRDRWYFDCGHDSYFNPNPAQRVIPHWQVGSRHNVFLDFRNQPPYDPAIACPWEVQVGYRASCGFSAFDREGPVRHRVEWGDGASEVSGFVAPGMHALLEHAWDAPGNYTVRLTSEDGEGATSAGATHVVRVLGCALQQNGRIRVGVPLVEIDGLSTSGWRPVSPACRSAGYDLQPVDAGLEVHWRDASGARLAACGEVVPAGAAEYRVVARRGTNHLWTLEAPVPAVPC